jgi:hypothetical protein
MNPVPGLLMIWLVPKRVLWFNCSYAVPSLIYSVFAFRLWLRQQYNFNVNFVVVNQQYAYLMAIKDRMFGTTVNTLSSSMSPKSTKCDYIAMVFGKFFCLFVSVS